MKVEQIVKNRIFQKKKKFLIQNEAEYQISYRFIEICRKIIKVYILYNRKVTKMSAYRILLEIHTHTHTSASAMPNDKQSHMYIHNTHMQVPKGWRSFTRKYPFDCNFFYQHFWPIERGDRITYIREGENVGGGGGW